MQICRSRSGSGFTLFEVLIVLLLLAVLYSLVPPLFSVGGSTAELKAAARQVAAGLRKAQGQALAGQSEAVLSLDVEARTFRVSGDDKTYRLPEALTLSVVTAQTEVDSGQEGSIRFYPDGSSTGGRITVARGDRRFLVDVDWLTGRVEIGDGS